MNTYRHSFPGGLRCEFDLSFNGSQMRWTPDRPAKSWPHWRSYRRWRDRCLHDFANRSGVMLVARLDVPWEGIRGFDAVFRDHETAYRYHAAQRDELRNAAETIESRPGVRAELLARTEESMLRHASRAAGAMS